MALTAHDDLRTLACRLFDAAGLQRGRLTGIAWKGEALFDATRSPSRSAWMPPAKPAWSPKPPCVGVRLNVLNPVQVNVLS
ncbi:hypothetical protein [Streptomyces marokkonensis]|uniref:hypothetical protein n=1 Tax=Streptomyces marokkonensis TaxID=324855 RepID=UPI003137CB6F